MELFDAIGKRQSYRGAFAQEAIPREDLRRIVQAGLDAPSGVNRQTTRFIIVDEPKLLEEIRGMHAKSAAMQQARAYIVCLIDRAPEGVYEGYSFQVEDCAAAVENMLLAITAMGYASVWVDGWLRLEGRAERIGQLLGVPPGKAARIILPVGRPVEEYPRMEKMAFGERAWFNRWGNA